MQDYLGDILYEIFWCLVIFWFVLRTDNLAKLKIITTKITLVVFAVTCVIEVRQLWFYLVSPTVRSSLVWKLLLGSSFAWWDFPHYALGSLLGWWIIFQIGRIDQIKNSQQ